MMLVKSFNDDLAWEVQRQLINVYFSVQAMMNAGELVHINDFNKMVARIDALEDRITQRDKMSPWETEIRKKLRAWKDGHSPNSPMLKNMETDEDLLNLFVDSAMSALGGYSDFKNYITTYAAKTGDYKPSIIKVADYFKELHYAFDEVLDRKVERVSGGYRYKTRDLFI